MTAKKSQKQTFYERALQERTDVETREIAQINRASMNLDQKEAYDAYVSELSWIVNDGFSQRTVKKIQGEYLRLANQKEGREHWSSDWKTAVVRMAAIRKVTEWTQQELESITRQTHANYSANESVELRNEEVSEEIKARIIDAPKIQAKLQILSAQTAVCPFCEKKNFLFNVKYLEGKDVNGNDLTGRNYPFAIELPEVACMCNHYYFSSAGARWDNWTTFRGSSYDLAKNVAARRFEQEEEALMLQSLLVTEVITA